MPEEIKGIVRIAGTDIKGENQLYSSLIRIKGVGGSLASAVCRIHNFDRRRKVGTLTTSDIKKIEETISNPIKFGVPSWMVNRRKDIETGEDRHLVAVDLNFMLEQDIKRMIKIKSYKGIRHMFGLPVRGQRTRSSFRGGTTVGVVKKKLMPATAKKEKKE
ncbi:MAG: 30S ribosomal protein S13 [Candidatus Aenigmarchaeota archaeon]|nr:30S ribosomal protein S13 [Candidatus Aenigmarchaeota archaeon]